jgi:hypothetical protein
MADDAGSTRHNLNDVWQAIGKQSEDIANIRAGQAALDARVDHGFQNISVQLQGIFTHINQPAPTPDVKGWIAIAVSIVLALGAVGWSNLQPVKEVAVSNATTLYELRREFFFQQGYSQGVIENVRQRLERIDSVLDAPGSCR